MSANFYWIMALAVCLVLAGYFWNLYRNAKGEFFGDDFLCLVFAFLAVFGLILFLWISLTLWRDHWWIALLNGAFALAFAAVALYFFLGAALDFYVFVVEPFFKEKLKWLSK